MSRPKRPAGALVQLRAHDYILIASEAFRSTTTVRRAYEGALVSEMSLAAIIFAAKKLGFPPPTAAPSTRGASSIYHGPKLTAASGEG